MVHRPNTSFKSLAFKVNSELFDVINNAVDTQLFYSRSEFVRLAITNYIVFSDKYITQYSYTGKKIGSNVRVTSEIYNLLIMFKLESGLSVTQIITNAIICYLSVLESIKEYTRLYNKNKFGNVM